MEKSKKNYAFIDSQNLYRGIERLGWKLNWDRFRIYLKEKYGVSTAYLFIGYVAQRAELYATLQKAGYVLIFKPTLPNGKNEIKGNIDADLVLQAMIDFSEYDKAVIVSSDGDFYSLVKHLYEKGKLEAVLSPHSDTCSVLLRRSAKEKIFYMDNLKRKLQYKRKGTA